MKSLVLISLLFLTCVAHAETRRIIVEVFKNVEVREKDSALVTIHSKFHESDQRTKITVKEASEILSEVESYTMLSAVVVLVVDDMQLKEYLGLVESISENKHLTFMGIRHRSTLMDDWSTQMSSSYQVEPVE